MKIKLSILLMITMFALSGCTNGNVENEGNTNEGTKVEENIDKEETLDDESEEDLSMSESQENNDEKEDTDASEENKSEEENKEENESDDTSKNDDVDNTDVSDDTEFVIYTRDVHDTEKVIEFKSVDLSGQTSVEGKINELINVLKNDYFKDSNIDIKLVSIDNNIAKIDLVNKEAWHPHFQGSTGGYISQSTIVETLLQRDYDGEWIDGVDVLIDGEKVEVFDHAPFAEVFYR